MVAHFAIHALAGFEIPWGIVVSAKMKPFGLSNHADRAQCESSKQWGWTHENVRALQWPENSFLLTSPLIGLADKAGPISHKAVFDQLCGNGYAPVLILTDS